jgi:hypothetical protein
MLELPAFVKVTGRVLVLPALTLLKFKVDTLAVSCPGEPGMGVGVVGGGTASAVTMTLAEADLVGSALLVAVILAVPGIAGAA